jgi:hypothetical protein
MRTTKPTLEEFDGHAPKYYMAVQEYCKHLESKTKTLKHTENELEMYKKIMHNEVAPLTAYLSNHQNFMAAAWGSSSIVVALKLLKEYDKLARWVAKKHLNGPEVQEILHKLGYKDE